MIVILLKNADFFG